MSLFFPTQAEGKDPAVCVDHHMNGNCAGMILTFRKDSVLVEHHTYGYGLSSCRTMSRESLRNLIPFLQEWAESGNVPHPNPQAEYGQYITDRMAVLSVKDGEVMFQIQGPAAGDEQGRQVL